MKTVISQRYNLNVSFEEILNLLDIWINERSARKIDQIDGLYISTSNYEPLSGVVIFHYQKIRKLYEGLNQSQK